MACIRHQLTAVVLDDKQKGQKAHDRQVRTIEMQMPAGIAGNLQDHAGRLSVVPAPYVHFSTTCLAVQQLHMHSIVTMVDWPVKLYGCCNQLKCFFEHSLWVCRSSKQIGLAQQSGATL